MAAIRSPRRGSIATPDIASSAPGPVDSPLSTPEFAMTPSLNDKDQRLKLAIQKSGRLTDPSLELLKNCGLKLSRGRDQLMGFGENMPLDVLFVRDDDIPDLVQEDVCDLGLVGRNVLEEKRLELQSRGHAANFTEVRTLEYGRCRLSLAVPEGFTYEGPRSLAKQ